MDKYKIFETSEFLNKLEKITSREKAFIEKKLIHFVYPQLREEPHFGNNIKKLVNYSPYAGELKTSEVLSIAYPSTCFVVKKSRIFK